MIRLFVYGTLKQGGRNVHLLKGQKFLGAAETLPRYRLYDAGPYPCLVEDAGAGMVVRGELWEIDEELLPTLDRLENAPELYRLAAVELRSAEPPVFAYFYQKDVSGFVDCDGVWRRQQVRE